MNKAFLDIDILSEISRGKNAVVTEKADNYKIQFGRFTFSTVTVMEVVKGLHKLSRSKRLREFLEAVEADEVLPLDFPSAELAGRIYADLERTGQTIGRADPMIAAIAMRHSLVLATGNTDHYKRIVALGYPIRLENWRE
jgi:tRNA(fMet)-specific endonuclease VapC